MTWEYTPVDWLVLCFKLCQLEAGADWQQKTARESAVKLPQFASQIWTDTMFISQQTINYFVLFVLG